MASDAPHDISLLLRERECLWKRLLCNQERKHAQLYRGVHLKQTAQEVTGRMGAYVCVGMRARVGVCVCVCVLKSRPLAFSLDLSLDLSLLHAPLPRMMG